MHVGTLVALIAYFQRDLLGLWRGFKASFSVPRAEWTPDSRFSWYILAATVPAMSIGAAMEGALIDLLRTPAVAVITLILGGILFLVFERELAARMMSDLTLMGGVLVGFAQAVALIQGVSRSGITILAGMSLELKTGRGCEVRVLARRTDHGDRRATTDCVS